MAGENVPLPIFYMMILNEIANVRAFGLKSGGVSFYFTTLKGGANSFNMKFYLIKIFLSCHKNFSFSFLYYDYLFFDKITSIILVTFIMTQYGDYFMIFLFTEY